jgi:putative membrane protein
MQSVNAILFGMNLTIPNKVLLAINIVVVAGFSWYYLQQLNYEFLAYAGTIAVVTAVLFGTLKWTKFSSGIIFGVTIWGIMHMLGGSVMTQDGVLYAYRIFPFFDGGEDFFILKFDQVVHAFLYGVVGLMFFHLLRETVGVKTHVALIAGTAIFAAAGFGIINEIIEFLAEVNLRNTGVGGYENTVLDLIFNLSGAASAVISKVVFFSKS